MNSPWTVDRLLALNRAHQPAAVLAAAADLDLFTLLAPRPLSAAAVAHRLRADPRGVTVLLDALAALQLLSKRRGHYRMPPSLVPLTTPRPRGSVLAMLQHQANCLRRWAELARSVKTGRPARRVPSIRGAAADLQSFIGAMDDISAPVADEVLQPLGRFRVRHLLDVGGASGTWTIAFLRAHPGTRATLFDLPAVIPLARRRLRAAGLLGRVELAAGDYHRDAMPQGADLAWVSAIIHQNSRAENRALFRRVARALVPGGRIAVRDLVMAPDHTRPVGGALFAVNMLVGTPGGGTFSLAELRADLAAAGFGAVRVARHDEGMNAIVLARRVRKPQGSR